MEELTSWQFAEAPGLSVETAALSEFVFVQTSLHKPRFNQYDNLKYKDTIANLKQHLTELWQQFKDTNDLLRKSKP